MIVVGLVEDAGDAFHLYLHMVEEALPHRLAADGAVACDGPAAAVADKDDAAVLLQIERHRAVLAADNVHAIGFLPAIVGIVGKDQSTDGELRTLEMLNPQEQVAGHLEQLQRELRVILVGEIAPGSRHATDTGLQQMVEHHLIVMGRIERVAVYIEIEASLGMLQSATTGIATGVLILGVIGNA